MSNLAYFFCLLLTVSFLWPSEGAINGDGLQWSIAWLCVTVFGIRGYRRPGGGAARGRNGFFGISILPVVLLVIGFWFSTWHVFRIGGDRRAAVNLSFEWTALVAVWWLTRRIVQNERGFQTINSLIVAMGVGISVMGIFQHHVTYPQQAEWYQDQIRQSDDSGILSGVAASTVQKQLQQIGVPLDGPGRELFESRLLSSSEPMGTFALANTLGGVLAVVFVLLLAICLESMQSTGGCHNVGRVLVFGLLWGTVSYCLLLTKSRTAWCGCAVGIVSLFLQKREWRFSVWLKRAAMLVICFAVFGIFGFTTGAIDKEVLLEAPKSLQYRFFYWIGAAGVIADSPLWGAGPGNFRQSYLAHKVAESSEEILDPHNIFFDAWGAAGVMGFVAVSFLFCCVISSTFFQSKSQTELKKPDGNSCVAPVGALVMVILSGTFLHLVWRWFAGGVFWDLTSSNFFVSDNFILLVPIGACVAVVAMGGRMRVAASAPRAALLCLLTHLLGAGGLQISIVGALIVVLYAMGESSPSSETRIREWRLHNIFTVFGVAVVCSVIGVIITFGLLPVLRCQSQIAVAEYRNQVGDVKVAMSAVDDAIRVDPLDVQSRQQKLEILATEFSRDLRRYAQASVIDSSRKYRLQSDFNNVLNACSSLIDADRKGLSGYLYRSRLRAMMANVFSNSQLLESAMQDMKHVVDAYPTNSSHRAEYALLQFAANDHDRAILSAQAALNLDTLNHTWGHADRYLGEDLVAKLVAIAEGA